MELLKIIKQRKKAKKNSGHQWKTNKPSRMKNVDELSTIISIDESSSKPHQTLSSRNISTNQRVEAITNDDVSQHSKRMDEQAIRQTFQGVWSKLDINGGYQVKIHYVRVPSTAQYYPIVVEVTNNSGQLNIFIKGRTFIEVLKGFAYEVMKHCKDLAQEVNLPFFADVIQNSQFIDVRKIPHGSNEYRANNVNNKTYKDQIMFFMFPREKGVQSEVIEQFKTFLHKVFSSTHFFILMESYTKLIPNQGGDIGKHLRVKDSDAWKILRRFDNYNTMWIDSLDAKLMDEDINKALESMFPNESHKDAYQKIGWKHKISSPWTQIKQEKNINNGL